MGCPDLDNQDSEMDLARGVSQVDFQTLVKVRTYSIVSVLQSIAVRYSTVQYNTVHDSTVQYNTVRHIYGNKYAF